MDKQGSILFSEFSELVSPFQYFRLLFHYFYKSYAALMSSCTLLLILQSFLDITGNGNVMTDNSPHKRNVQINIFLFLRENLMLLLIIRNEHTVYDAQRTKRVLMQSANNEGPDQPAHSHRLIWAFIVHL